RRHPHGDRQQSDPEHHEQFHVRALHRTCATSFSGRVVHVLSQTCAIDLAKETEMHVTRFTTNPIIRPGLDDRMGDNINGPSLIRVPDWIEKPLGRYYLYFAHHDGDYIR